MTCRDWLAGAEPPELLHEAGCRVHVLCPPGAWPTKGSFVDAWFPLPVDPDAAAETLRLHLVRYRYAWVVFGDDPILSALARRRGEDWLDGVLPIDRRGGDVEMLGSKAGLARVCARHRLPTPHTAVVDSLEAARAVAGSMRYPLVVKIDRSSGGVGVFLARDAAQLERVFPLDPVGEVGVAVVIQERLAGPVWSAEALYDRGRLRACATSIMTRSWPRPFGASAQRQYLPAPDLDALVGRAGAAISAHGFANITAVQDIATGRHLLFELDLRVNASLRLAAVAGVDFAREVRAMLAGAPIRPPACVAAVAANLYPHDVVRCLEEPDVLGLAAWLLGRRRALPASDLRLERAYLGYIVRRKLAAVLPAKVVRQVRRWRRRARINRPA